MLKKFQMEEGPLKHSFKTAVQACVAALLEP